jgi:uroporphyrinogen-III synthase/uroporphyrinogen III methyltransferase/synthase
MTALPLAGRRVLEGKRILVMRAAHQAGKLSEGLRALGAVPVEVPVLEIQPPADPAPLDRALRILAAAHTDPCKADPCPILSASSAERTGNQAANSSASLQSGYDWLILTSANTVRALVERSEVLGLSLALGPQLQVAAVGEATAAAARKAGLPVALVPENYVAESLVEELLNKAKCSDALKGHDLSRAEQSQPNEGALAPEGSLQGLRFLIARAEIARDVIPDALRAAGATVDVVDAYRNVMPAAAPELLRAALGKGIDAATFTSSSSVTHLAAAAREAGIAFPFAGVRAISIGPITSQTLRDLGWEPAAEASVSDIPGLTAAVDRVLRA